MSFNFLNLIIVGLLWGWCLEMPKQISLWSEIRSSTLGFSRSTVEFSLVIIWSNRLPLWWIGSNTHCLRAYDSRNSRKAVLFGISSFCRFTFKPPRMRGWYICWVSEISSLQTHLGKWILMNLGGNKWWQLLTCLLTAGLNIRKFHLFQHPLS